MEPPHYLQYLQQQYCTHHFECTTQLQSKFITLPLPTTIISSREQFPDSSHRHTSRVEHEYLHTLCTCVSFSRVQTISLSTVKTLKCCVMLSSVVYLTSCTSRASLQNSIWTGSLCQAAMSPGLSFCHQLAPSLRQGPSKVTWFPLTQQTRLTMTIRTVNTY